MSHLTENALQLNEDAGPFQEWIVGLDLTVQRLRGLAARMPAMMGRRIRPPKEIRRWCYALALDIEHWRKDFFRIASAQNPARYTAGYFMDIFGGHIFDVVRGNVFTDVDRRVHEYGDEVALEVVDRVRTYVLALSQRAQINEDYIIV